MLDTLGRVAGALAWQFLDMPPLVFVLVSTGLLACGLWIGRHAWVSLRIVLAARGAPVVDVGSAVAGLVKLQGTARPPPPKPGFDESSTVWRKSVRSSGSHTTTSRTVGEIRIQTATGMCAMNVAHARVVPSVSEMKEDFLSNERWSSSGAIRRGDPVFALGSLHARPERGAGAAQPRFELRPAGGVLLLSGAPERQVQVQFGIWLLLQAPASLALLSALLLGVWVHVGSYPPGGLGSVRTFLETLWQQPLSGRP